MNSELYLSLLILCGILALFAPAGFAMMETGFTRAKNAGHTMAMGLAVFGVALIGYWAIGYGLQTGGKGFFFSMNNRDSADAALFLFRAATMIVAATIPTGAMAERWTFKSFVFSGFFFSIVVYPILAHWVCSGGWLSELGVKLGLGHGVLDVAGSSMVHMTGGLAGLAGAIALRARMGKFRPDGTPMAIPGHNIPLAVAGSLVLFFAWFGLNIGPVLGAGAPIIGLVAVNTMLAAASAALSALCYMWILYGKPDLSLAVNGLVGGLVAISASCAFVSPFGAIIIGLASGALCCMSVFFMERKLKIDDPVGAVSVHGICGAWGMIALGFFADGKQGEGLNGIPGAVKGLFYGGGSQLVSQLIGVIVTSVFVFGIMYIFFILLNKLVPLRVADEVEFEGLDQSEVAVTAYPDFSITKTRR